MTSLYLNYVFKSPLSIYSHILRYLLRGRTSRCEFRGGYTLESSTYSLTPRCSTQHPFLPTFHTWIISFSLHYPNSCSLCFFFPSSLDDMIRRIPGFNSPRINSILEKVDEYNGTSSRTQSLMGMEVKSIGLWGIFTPSTSSHHHPLAAHPIT